ncbi:MAG TPA: hypothetical protein VFN55_03965 [Solirubrobacteraceae bacterium]|nr:hypothetical protein [Solirubrobacteraceae bacterium]
MATQSFPTDPAAWHQCNAAGLGGLNTTVHTTQFGNGVHTLSTTGSDAAGLSTTVKTSVSFDNTAPTISLSGPSDVPTTSGPATVTATATAGPSGIYGIDCALDGGPTQHFAASSAQVSIPDTAGQHTVSCTAQNNAVDASGNRATSAPATTTVKVGIPTVAALGFSTLVDGLRCHHVTETIHFPARWVTVVVRGHRLRVRERAHRQRIRLTRCRVRTARRTVTTWVAIKRHGRTVRVRRRRSIRVLLRPHRINRTTRVVAHGHGTTVDGWVGTTSGVALGGQPVEVLTAVDDGTQHYTLAATTTTRADGSWSARIGPGPSRLIEAVYPGAATTEATQSTPVSMIVPARIRLLRVTPVHVAWGGTVRLTGRLLGGHLPAGGALVRLRIGLGRTFITYGVHEHVSGSGRFTTSYTFGAGQPSVYRTYSFQLASLPMGDYPYAPAASNRIRVTVGGHPVVRRHGHGHPHRRR